MHIFSYTYFIHLPCTFCGIDTHFVHDFVLFALQGMKKPWRTREHDLGEKRRKIDGCCSKHYSRSTVASERRTMRPPYGPRDTRMDLIINEANLEV